MHPYHPPIYFLYRFTLISKMVQMAQKMVEFSQLAEKLPPWGCQKEPEAAAMPRLLGVYALATTKENAHFGPLPFENLILELVTHHCIVVIFLPLVPKSGEI